MAKPRSAAPLSALPVEVRTPLKRALASGDGETKKELVDKALEAAGFEYGPTLPLADRMSPLQRSVVEILAHDDVVISVHGLPAHAEGRRRWLGLGPEKPGLLERLVDSKHPGDPPRVPLWRALFLNDEDLAAMAKIVGGMKLSLLERLELFAEIERNYYGFRYTVGVYFPWGTAAEIAKQPKKAGAWASALADRIVASNESKQNGALGWWCARGVAKDLRRVMFMSLLAGKVPLKPEWDALLPVAFRQEPDASLVARILAALPIERRGPACVRMLEWHQGGGKVITGLPLLEKFPSKELTELIVKHMGDDDTLPKRDTAKKLAALAKKHPTVRDALDPSVFAKPIVNLSVTRAFKPRVPKDLTPLQQKQLVVAGSWYDGKKWPVAVRLGLEIPKGRKLETFEGSFGGWLEVRELEDDAGKPAYTAFLYLVDLGAVFVAGTTEVAASIVQSRIDHCADPLREALQPFLQSKLPKTKTKPRAKANAKAKARTPP
jgi:hypothetical protein